ncbi:MAG: GNAT family N-acetyltransferase [Velocimicrobium sp.]
MNSIIESGIESDIDQVAQLYDDLNDFLNSGMNYPGWMKGIYPNRRDAEVGIAKGTLYVAKIAEEIVGTIILNHEPEPAYSKAGWKDKNSDYSRIFVVHTFAVHPSHLKKGIGMELMNFVNRHAIEQGATSIRLDVYENNIPAIMLYEKSGFEYVNTVDLGLGRYGLHHFKLYENKL